MLFRSELDSKTLFPLGIIINELLTNIMKYAFQGRDSGAISLELTRLPGTTPDRQEAVRLVIPDNGVGLPEGFNMDTAKGFGLMLVRMLCQQLGGTFTTGSGQGTRSILTFPR